MGHSPLLRGLMIICFAAGCGSRTLDEGGAGGSSSGAGGALSSAGSPSGIGGSSSGNGGALSSGGSPSGVGGSSSVFPTNAEGWVTKAPMLTPRSELGTAVLDGEIYAIGGTVGTTVGIVEVYDPASNAWSSRASMPTPRQRLVTAALGGRIYAIGGFETRADGFINYTSVTEIYDPAADSWSPGAAPPIPPAFNEVRGNQFIAGAAVGGKILIALCDMENALLEYDVGADSWTITPGTVGGIRSQAISAASLGDKLYVLSAGGMVVRAPLAYFDGATGLWYNGAGLLRMSGLSPSSHTVGASAGALYAVGGTDYGIQVDEPLLSDAVLKWTPESSEWAFDKPMPRARHSVGTATIGDTLYVIGGSVDPWQPTPAVADVTAATL